MSANEYQIGGQHYKAGFEHWDFVTAANLGYLDGSATKYIARNRKKHGLEDLQKARHYLEKMEEAEEQYHRIVPEDVVDICGRFSRSNQLNPLETELILTIATRRLPADIHRAILLVQEIIDARQRTEQPRPFGFDPSQDVA